MKLFSFIDENESLAPVEVELELWPGLPEIHFIGRADQHLRESAKRIKSAIRAQGFDFPVAQQILVNLKPSYLKKSSRGLELAVAAGYLMESGQIPKVIADSKTFYYGELSLTGEVAAPEGLSRLKPLPHAVLTTGSAKDPFPFSYRRMRSLRDLPSPDLIEAQIPRTVWRPNSEILDLSVSEKWARFLGIVALGGHSILLAGAAGGGKTTAAKILHALLPAPSPEECEEILRRTPGAWPEVFWRPLVQPHHTIPMHSLMGGGVQAYGGDLARADLGVLLLDELLEFSPLVIEALREPLEQKKLRVSRGLRVQEYSLRTQFVGTTNLCPCGDFVPGEVMKQRCRYTLQRCRSYAQKISGPLLDRFQILQFLKPDSAEKSVKVSALRAKIEKIRERLKGEGRPSVDEPIEHIKARLNPFFLKHDWEKQSGSHRRRIATLKVAQSICDWEGGAVIEGRHLEEARGMTVTSFERLKRWDLR